MNKKCVNIKKNSSNTANSLTDFKAKMDMVLQSIFMLKHLNVHMASNT